MWDLSKYDSLEALKTPMIKETLPRYVGIILDDLPANYLIAKRIVVEFDKNMSNDELWAEHDTLMHKFHQVQTAIDQKKLDMAELEEPRFSLLDLKILLAEAMLKSCNLCERRCRVDRTAGELGECKVPTMENCTISSENIHLGEEAHIVPSHTIFFMGCNFHCQYCQNWTISQWQEAGDIVPPGILAKAVSIRKSDGARNVNWVGGEPTPQLFCILKTLRILEVNTPQIWNSNFYMSDETMKLLDGLVDMYLSDFKYGNDECAFRLSKASNYFDIVSRNHLEAVKQAELTIRHLVLPDHVECCTKPVFDWIAENIRDRAIVNIMDQFYPAYRAYEYVDLKRCVNDDEMKEALNYAEKLKLKYVS